MSTKTCPGCPENGPQPLEDFYACGRSKDGHQTRCKVCQRAYQADNRDAAYDRMIKQRTARNDEFNRGPGTLFPNSEV